MKMLFGEHSCKIDAKGRMMLPAKLRASLLGLGVESFFLVRGFEPCLNVYSTAEFKKRLGQILSLSDYDPEARMIKRNYTRGVEEVEPDANGRFLIPKQLKAFAQLDKEALVIGTGDKLEIWNAELMDSYSYQDTKEYSSKVQKLLKDA